MGSWSVDHDEDIHAPAAIFLTIDFTVTSSFFGITFLTKSTNKTELLSWYI